ncbi:MAG: hypothetical protein NVSMB70_01090 [Chamaesiphon sp.]
MKPKTPEPYFESEARKAGGTTQKAVVGKLNSLQAVDKTKGKNSGELGKQWKDKFK